MLAAPPDCILSMTVWDLLICLRRYGPDRVAKKIRKLGVSEIRPVGMLTERERGELCKILGGGR